MRQMTTCLSCLRNRSRLHEGLPCCSSSMTLMPNPPIAYTVVCMRLLNLPVFLLWSEFTFFFSPVPLLLWSAVWSAYKGFWKKKSCTKGFELNFGEGTLRQMTTFVSCLRCRSCLREASHVARLPWLWCYSSLISSRAFGVANCWIEANMASGLVLHTWYTFVWSGKQGQSSPQVTFMGRWCTAVGSHFAAASSWIRFFFPWRNAIQCLCYMPTILHPPRRSQAQSN